MDGMEEQIREVAKLTDFSERLLVYKKMISTSYAFIVWSISFTVAALAAWSTIFGPWFPTFVKAFNWVLTAALGSAGVVGMFLMFYIFSRTVPLKAKQLDMKPTARWVFSFVFPYGFAYIVAFLVGIETVISVTWYVALAGTMLHIAALVENEYVKKGLFVARPFFLAGVLMMITSPLVLFTALVRNTATYTIEGVGHWSSEVAYLSANMLALTLMLAIYFVASLYTFFKAEGAMIRHETQSQ